MANNDTLQGFGNGQSTKKSGARSKLMTVGQPLLASSHSSDLLLTDRFNDEEMG